MITKDKSNHQVDKNKQEATNETETQEKSQQQRFNPSQNDIDTAKAEYFRNGGSNTVIPPIDEKHCNSHTPVLESRSGMSLSE